MITLEERATEFREVVSTCTLCPLSVTRTNAVPGEGPLTAEVMCIGEAPGVNEDKQGMPFVGAAGNFLTELLAAGGLKREDVYICNVLKCRPPSNRDPMPDEIQACSEYLDLQLDMVDPLVVITLGRFSMAKWFPQQTISRIHGSVKEVDGRLVVPMYHPAAALHQGSLRQVLLDDFGRLPAILARARALQDGPQPTEAAFESAQLAATGPHSPTTSPDSVSLAGEGEIAGFEPEQELPALPATGPRAPTPSPDSVSLAGEGEIVSSAPETQPNPPGVRANSQESTAEPEPASAAKSAQLSLFE